MNAIQISGTKVLLSSAPVDQVGYACGMSLSDYSDADITLSHYDPQCVSLDALASRVFVNISLGEACFCLDIDPDKARALAALLVDVARRVDKADVLWGRFETAKENIRSANGPSGRRINHPWVHYVAPDRVASKTAELEALGKRRFLVLADPKKVAA